MSDLDKLTPVYVLAWDGEPSMSGLPHRASGGEFTSFDNARDAAKRARIDRKPGFRIERRYVTEWEVVPHA